MPFDETLADRLRPLFGGKYSVAEKKMFGGLAFMVNGHMCCGIVGHDLVVRTGGRIRSGALPAARQAYGLHRTSDEGHGVRCSRRIPHRSRLEGLDTAWIEICVGIGVEVAWEQVLELASLANGPAGEVASFGHALTTKVA